MKNSLDETRVRELVRAEIHDVFGTLTTDVREIKRALLGSKEFGDKGLIEDISEVKIYVGDSKSQRLIERSGKALKWYEAMTEENAKGESSMKILVELLDNYKLIKIVSYVLFATGLLNAGQLIRSAIEWITTHK